jgi:putative ABC transport system ATP-binding protein
MSLVEIRNVRKIYRVAGEEVRALDGIDLDIDAGEFVAIIGPSGSGKSTLMHLLGCLDTPTEGSIKLEGVEISKAGSNQLADIRNRKIGFVFQSFNLLPRMNVLQNIELPMIYMGMASRPRHDAGMRALDQVGIANRAKHVPAQLSGGQSQRAAIARALVNDPKILLADEPTGNLDSHTGETILELFHELNRKGRTIVIVTHDPKIAAQARRQIEIRDGKIVPASDWAHRNAK